MYVEKMYIVKISGTGGIMNAEELKDKFKYDLLGVGLLVKVRL